MGPIFLEALPQIRAGHTDVQNPCGATVGGWTSATQCRNIAKWSKGVVGSTSCQTSENRKEGHPKHEELNLDPHSNVAMAMSPACCTVAAGSARLPAAAAVAAGLAAASAVAAGLAATGAVPTDSRLSSTASWHAPVKEVCGVVKGVLVPPSPLDSFEMLFWLRRLRCVHLGCSYQRRTGGSRRLGEIRSAKDPEQINGSTGPNE